jgi:hypothetical protein
MPSRGKSLGVALGTLHQVGHRDPAVGRRTRAAFQLGQGQQVRDQGLHAAGLLLHQRQHSAPLGFGQGQCGHGLDEARENRQRRADLVRHVRDEVAPHGVAAFAFGDVLRQHELHAVAVGTDEDRQGAAAVRCHEDHRLLEASVGQVGLERGRSHEVGHALPPIAVRVQGKVLGSHRVAPVDLLVRIDQQDAVRRCFHRRKKLLQAATLRLDVLLARAKCPLGPVAELAPEAGVAGSGGNLRAAQPLQQLAATHGIRAHDHRHADGRAQNSARHGPVAQCTRNVARRSAAGARSERREDAREQDAHPARLSTGRASR